MSTVSDWGMRTYLEAFHRTYGETISAKVPADLVGHLARHERLSDGIVGYVSTQFGAGFEYVSSEQKNPPVTLVKGSGRIEDLVFDAPPAVRKREPMIRIGGHASAVSFLTLDGGFPVRLTSPQASVVLRQLRAKVGPWVRDVEWAELFGDRSSEFWSVEQATRRALEEVLQAVVDAREMERRNLDLGSFLARFRQRRVLLLGDFGSGRDRLSAIVLC